MSIHSHRDLIRTGIGTAVIAFFVLGVGAWRLGMTYAGQSDAPNAKSLYAQARHEQDGNGNMKTAISLYERALAAKPDRALAAQALFHMAESYQKLSDPKAYTIFEQVVRDYPKEPVAANAKRQLAALGGSSSAPSRLTARLIYSEESTYRYYNSISADGRFIAFEESSGLRIRDMLTGEVRPIVNNLGGRGNFPVLSPDGRHAAYTWTVEGRPVPGVADTLLRVTSSEPGGEPKTLVENSEFIWFEPVAWAPNGKKILVTVTKPDRTWQLVWVSLADGNVEVIKSLGWRLIGTWGRPALSPDGKYIAYGALEINPSVVGTPDSTDQHIYVLAADGSGSEIELVNGANINESPVWTPDGKSLLFISNRRGNFGLWSVAFHGEIGTAGPVQIKADTGRFHAIGMTSSGTYYYWPSESSFKRIQILPALHTSNSQAASSRIPETLLGVNPVWSPDSKSIAFHRQTKFDQNRPNDNVPDTLLIHSFGTGKERRYAPSIGMKLVPDTPLWFHDGSALLQMMQDSKGDRSIYRVDVKSGEVRRVASAPTIDAERVALSSDDRTIYMIARAQTPTAGPSSMDRVVAVDLKTSQQRDVSVVSQARSLTLSPDDKTLYMKICDPRCQRVVAIDVSTGRQRQIFTVQDPDLELIRLPLALSPDGHALAFVITKAGAPPGQRGTGTPPPTPTRLVRIGVDGNDYRELDRSLIYSEPYLFWTADGSGLIAKAKPSAQANAALMRIPARGGNPKLIPSPRVLRAVDLNPAGDRLAVAIEEASYNIWALDNVGSFLKTAR